MNVYLNQASTLEEAYQEIADLGKIFRIEDRANTYRPKGKNCRGGSKGSRQAAAESARL